MALGVEIGAVMYSKVDGKTPSEVVNKLNKQRSVQDLLRLSCSQRSRIMAAGDIWTGTRPCTGKSIAESFRRTWRPVSNVRGLWLPSEGRVEGEGPTEPTARKKENMPPLASMYCDSVESAPRGPAPPLRFLQYLAKPANRSRTGGLYTTQR